MKICSPHHHPHTLNPDRTISSKPRHSSPSQIERCKSRARKSVATTKHSSSSKEDSNATHVSPLSSIPHPSLPNPLVGKVYTIKRKLPSYLKPQKKAKPQSPSNSQNSKITPVIISSPLRHVEVDTELRGNTDEDIPESLDDSREDANDRGNEGKLCHTMKKGTYLSLF